MLVAIERLQTSIIKLKSRPLPNTKDGRWQLKHWIKTEERILKLKIKLLERGYL